MSDLNPQRSDGAIEERDADSVPLLRVNQLTVQYRQGWAWNAPVVRAVDAISLDLRARETLGIVGESGCGKSTTLRAILRLVAIQGGTIHWKGVRIDPLSETAMRPLRQQIQMIFQDPYASLNPRMPIGEIVAEPLHVFGRFPRAERIFRAMAMLERVGLNPRRIHQYPHEFSGGQRQRIGIARALILEPELVLCDEPVSALDVSIQAQVLNLLKDLQHEFELSYLFISHDLSVVRHVANRIAVMYRGKIVELAQTVDLFRAPRHPYTQVLLDAIPIPDPRRAAPAITVAHSSDPNHGGRGCVFAARCPRVEARCRLESPPLAGETHQVACFYPLT